MKRNIRDFASESTLLLLGAGASRGAKIPDNHGLNASILESLQKKYWYEVFPAIFQFVLSTMQAQKAATDSKPLQTLNFEEVVSTIKLLAERDTLEIRPFLGSWDYRLDIFDGPQNKAIRTYSEILKSLVEQIKLIIAKAGDQIYSDLERVIRMDGSSHFINKHSFERILSDNNSSIDREIENLAAKMAEATFKSQSIEGNFKRLYDVIHSLLTNIMWLDNADSLAYLTPLINYKPYGQIDIFTLNYDTAIEALCDKHQIPYSDGFEQTENGAGPIFTGNWANTKLRLYKLHGSINWRFAGRHTVAKANSKGDFVPALILGTRDKLRAEGPFLDILFEFKEKLKKVQNVVVIGYSFGDAHINFYLERWLRDQDHKITIVSGKTVELPSALRHQTADTGLTAEMFLETTH